MKSLYRLVLTNKYDRRFKFTDEDKIHILKLHKAGHSYRSIAKDVGCSLGFVSLTIYPDKTKEADRLRERKVYTKEERHANRMSNRAYKERLVADGVKLPESSKAYKRKRIIL